MGAFLIENGTASLQSGVFRSGVLIKKKAKSACSYSLPILFSPVVNPWRG